MTNPERESNREAERLISAVRCALAGTEAVRCRLIFDLRNVVSSKEVRPLQRRLEAMALKGSLNEALRELAAASTTNEEEWFETQRRGRNGADEGSTL